MLTTTLFITILCTALSSPIPNDPNENRVLYDQRQQGEWNVLADLKNIVIMVIPSQSATTAAATATGDLLSLLLRSIPARSHLKTLPKPAEETQHFIESKTAPYHVDISRSKSQLAKLRPEMPTVVNAEEIVIAKSPSIELLKEEGPRARIARAFVVTVPQETYEKKKDKKKKDMAKSVLKLLGAEYEQCGPGLVRDEEGVCRTLKN